MNAENRLKDLWLVKIGQGRRGQIAIIKAVDAGLAEKGIEIKMGREAGPFRAEPLTEASLTVLALANGRSAESIVGDFANIPPIIHAYSDGDAIQDGVLVALGPQHRMTRAVFEYLKEHAPLSAPPENWPVAIIPTQEITADLLAVSLAKGLIEIHGARALEIYRRNIGGGIWTAIMPLNEKSEIDALRVVEDSRDEHRLWLLPNERGGLTLMFPDDY